MLKKYAKSLQFRGMDDCSSQILAEVYERFPRRRDDQTASQKKPVKTSRLSKIRSMP